MIPVHDPVLKAFMLAKREFCHYERIADYIQHLGISDNVRLLAIGKAAWDMAAVTLKTLPGAVKDGFVLTKHGFSRGKLDPLEVLEAAHPIPDENSLRHSKRVLDWLEVQKAEDHLLVLISGGGSALFEYPVSGVTLRHLQALNASLLKSGKDIHAMNRERIEHSQVKGGKCLDRSPCRHIHVLMLSDVAGSDPRVIASGPFTPRILPADWDPEYPSKILHQGHQVTLKIIGDINSLGGIVQAKLRKAGFNVSSCGMDYYDDIQPFMDWIPKLIKLMEHFQGPLAVVMGGEMPIKVTKHGKGGRCTHLALLLAGTLSCYPDWRLYCLATDGNDNLPKVAGAYCDAYTYAQLLAKGIDPAKALSDNDSFTALNAIGNIIPARGRYTNVNDIYILARGLPEPKLPSGINIMEAEE